MDKMGKQQFLQELENRLFGIDKNELQKIIAFYAESIDDRIESGLSSSSAVAELGNLDEIVQEILADMPIEHNNNVNFAYGAPANFANNAYSTAGGNTAQNYATYTTPTKSTSGISKTILVILAIVCFPFWGPVLLAVVAIILSVFIAIWAVVLALFTVPLTFLLTGILLIAATFGALSFNVFSGFAMFGAALILIGISVLLFATLVLAVKYTAKFTAFIAKSITGLFSKKV